MTRPPAERTVDRRHDTVCVSACARLPTTTSQPDSTSSSSARSCAGAYDRSASVNAIVRPRGGEHAGPNCRALARLWSWTSTASAPALPGRIGGAIGRAVVDDDDLEPALERRRAPRRIVRDRRADAVVLLVCGHDDRQPDIARRRRSIRGRRAAAHGRQKSVADGGTSTRCRLRRRRVPVVLHRSSRTGTGRAASSRRPGGGSGMRSGRAAGQDDHEHDAEQREPVGEVVDRRLLVVQVHVVRRRDRRP